MQVTFKLLEMKESSQKWKYFEKGGYFILRTKWYNNINYLLMDCGRFGVFQGAPSHSNITNIIFSYKGSVIIINSGTFTYNKSLSKRNLFLEK